MELGTWNLELSTSEMKANLIQSLKERLLTALALLWYRLDRRHRRITLANLEFAYGAGPQPRGAGAPGPAGLLPFRALRLGDSANCSWPRCPVIRRKVIILGEEHLEAALAQGRGAVAIAAHAGNWEYTVMGYGLHMPARGGGGPGAGPALGGPAGPVSPAAGRQLSWWLNRRA